jgi:hypothetical protein
MTGTAWEGDLEQHRLLFQAPVQMTSDGLVGPLGGQKCLESFGKVNSKGPTATPRTCPVVPAQLQR